MFGAFIIFINFCWFLFGTHLDYALNFSSTRSVSFVYLMQEIILTMGRPQLLYAIGDLLSHRMLLYSTVTTVLHISLTLIFSLTTFF